MIVLFKFALRFLIIAFSLKDEKRNLCGLQGWKEKAKGINKK